MPAWANLVATIYWRGFINYPISCKKSNFSPDFDTGFLIQGPIPNTHGLPSEILYNLFWNLQAQKKKKKKKNS